MKTTEAEIAAIKERRRVAEIMKRRIIQPPPTWLDIDKLLTALEESQRENKQLAWERDSAALTAREAEVWGRTIALLKAAHRLSASFDETIAALEAARDRDENQ